MNFKGFYRVTLLLGIFIFTSCVKEDLKDCQQVVNIRFEYTLNSEYKDLFRDKINSLDLLIYNSSKELVDSYQLSQDNLESGNTLSIHGLGEEAPYTLVAWANMPKEQYAKNYASIIDDMSVSYKKIEGKEYNADPSLDSFFYGSLRITNDDIKVCDPLAFPLINNTHFLRILIEETSTSQPIDLATYKVELSGTNGVYNFENMTVGSDLLQYNPTYSLVQSNSITSDFTCLRVLENGDLRLRIYGHMSKLLYDKSLVDLLYESDQLNKQEDLDRESRYDLKFEVTRNNANVDVSLTGINDWNSVNQSGNL